MSKKKKRRRIKPRVAWMLLIGYVVLGLVVALFWLNRHAPNSDQIDAVRQGMANPWGLVPIIVMLWPIFLVIMLYQAFF